MLNNDQQDRLLLALFATAEAMGQQLTQGAALLMVDDLRDYDEPVLTAALRNCRMEGGRLTVSAILKHAQAADGRPGKDEAWGIAMVAFDERETVVLTDEIRAAMTAASAIFEARDKVGARMAFMSAYERLVTLARGEAKAVNWSVSLGQDPQGRAVAIETAVRLKLMPPERAALYLEDMAIAPTAITQDGLAIAGLLSGDVRPASPGISHKLEAVRAEIKKGKAAAEKARRKKAQADRVDTYLRKRKLRAALAELKSERGAA